MDECEVLWQLRRVPGLFEAIEAGERSELRLQKQLREFYPDELVRAAISLFELRKKGAAKFSRAGRMWFDRKGLEQATSEAVAFYKAKRFSGPVWDLCCGVGGCTIGLAGRCEVTAVDRRPAACLRTAWNAEAYDVADSVLTVCADVESLALKEQLVHIDPDRRPGRGRKTVRVEDARPGLEYLQRLIREGRGGVIKLSPAANFAGKFDDAEIELVSLEGECKEALIWFGELGEGNLRRATVLPVGESFEGDPLEAFPEVGPLQRYLHDPDPSVVRAGLIDLLAARSGCRRVDEAEEYFTSSVPLHSPFAQSFEVLEELPNNQREIRRYFRAAPFGRVEIKCRHIPVDVEGVRRKLPLPGDEPGVLIFARIQGKARALACRRCRRS